MLFETALGHKEVIPQLLLANLQSYLVVASSTPSVQVSSRMRIGHHGWKEEVVA